MKLNLGCGGDIRPGFVNIDAFVLDPDVLELDVAQLPYPPESCSEIIAQDVLEHLPHRVAPAILEHWCSLLDHGGTITIRCPDAAKQAELLVSGFWPVQTFAHMVYGGQDHEGNFHKTCFTMPSLTKLLADRGLEILAKRCLHEGLTPDKATSANANIEITARKP